jgi:hypothetical protein
MGQEITMISHPLSALTRVEKERHLQLHLVDHLSFEAQADREYRIAKAYSETFQWIFSKPDEQGDRHWSNFVTWLEGDEDHLYWITGKAGSGKSTLMKYILHEERCLKHLQVWAGNNTPLILARFYFWNSGSQSQMSSEGLLRSIIHDALKQSPHLAPILFPSRWRRYELFGSNTHPWTLVELMHAFENLVVSSGTKRFKLCLFVDGLDEFDGDHHEMINLFKRAVSFPNVKACLSSRPWVIFEEAFVRRPSIMLQDLTYPDIIRYTTENFHRNSGFSALRRREPEFAASLVENLVKKACGVFLWVTLVVKSLLTGLSNYDRIADLQRRLDGFPTDLEDFYQKIFNSIEPEYVEHACQLFRLAGEARSNLTALALSFADEEDDDLLFKSQVGPLAMEELSDRNEATKRRLNSRCKGLLEVASDNQGGSFDWLEKNNSETTLPDSPDECLTDEDFHRIAEGDYTEHPKTWNKNKLPKPRMISPTSTSYNVAYLHRTAKDFLESTQIQRFILAKTGSFDPSSQLLRSCMLVAKTWDRSTLPGGAKLWTCIDDFLKYAECVAATGRLQFEILDELNNVISALVAVDPLCLDQTFDYKTRHWCSTRPGNARGDIGFLGFIATYRLPSFLHQKVMQNFKVFPDEDQRPLLDYIITDYRKYPGLCDQKFIDDPEPVPSLALVKLLLDRGTDPNTYYSGRTIWEQTLRTCIQVSEGSRNGNKYTRNDALVPHLEHWSYIAETFLLFDADPRMDLKHSSIASCIREAFGMILPHRALKLKKILSRNKDQWSQNSKFIVPRVQINPPTLEDITPITVTNRQNSIRQQVPWQECFITNSRIPRPGLYKPKLNSILFKHLCSPNNLRYRI